MTSHGPAGPAGARERGISEDKRVAALREVALAGARTIADRVAALAAACAAIAGTVPWTEAAGSRVAAAAGLARQLAGSAATFGFPHVSRVAASLETALQGLIRRRQPSGDDLPHLLRLVDALQSALLRSPTSARIAAGGPTWQPPPVQGVYLAAPAGRLDDLRLLVTGLGFSVVAVDLDRPDALPRQVAALVIDAAERLDMAKIGPLLGRGPTILVADQIDLDARLAAARCGIDAVIPQPVDPGELAEWLNGFIGGASEQPYSVLVVDDDAVIARAYSAALEGAGMVVETTCDPAEVPALIAAHFPDLVLMDLQMPGISGIELAQVIRQSRRFLSLPIVFLSAEQDADRQLVARRFGGDDFITKPVDFEWLIRLVRLRAERARSLRSAMEHDSLTGLLHHGRFKDKLQHELERCRRTGAEISLAMLDLDHFKRVNDSYGHLAGDRVIRALARTLRVRLRRIDLIGRYGGEEFAVILLDTAPTGAFTAIDQVRQAFAQQQFREGDRTFRVTVSAGIASSRAHRHMNELIAAADALLYEAKRAGRDAVFVEGVSELAPEPC
ncbi:diguanylate cyclase [Stella sp.]|uniref:diguanylate cyclase n=1 Tax=Stella sp. TaxID=2912054 RepID=UPI0035B22839